MFKVKVGVSFLLLVLISVLCGQGILMINYFLALTLHELAHLWVALKNGYSLQTIKLDVFGLAVNLNEQIDDKDSFKINIAGPMFNLFLCVLCMAMYWLVPTSFYYLNTFCFCNLILAIFNLLPVYPLDGGKIFRGMVKNDKAYKILDIIIRSLLACLFICAFIFSCFKTANFILLVFAIFFVTSKGKIMPTMSIFKFRKSKHFDKVIILKVDESQTLFNLIKQIKSNHYTIFYLPNQNRFLDEEHIINLSLNHALTTTLKNLYWHFRTPVL